MRIDFQKFVVLLLAIFVSDIGSDLFAANVVEDLPKKKLDRFADCDIQADSSEYRFDTDWTLLRGNVAIKYGDIELRADKVRFNRITGDAEAEGNVVFFSTSGDVWRGENLKVNIFSGLAVSSKFDFYSEPVRVMANSGSVYTNPENKKEYLLTDSIVTTCTNELGHLHYQLKAKKLCLKPDDEMFAQGAVPYLFGIPVFYWPYYWKDLNRHYGFTFIPGYKRSWGAYLLSTYKMVIYRNKESESYVDSKTSIDLRSERGVALGEEILWESKEDLEGWISGYYLDDQYDDLPSSVKDSERYRIRLNNEWQVASRDRLLAQIIYVSDDRVMKDYFESEYDEMNQPDSYLAWTHVGDIYSGGLLGRMRLNDFYSQVERLPEAWYSLNSTELFYSGVYIENNSSLSFLRRQYDERIWETKDDPAYDAFRADSEFILTRPMKLMGFLSIVPRVGYRGTYYDKTRIEKEKTITKKTASGAMEEKIITENIDQDADFRNVFEFGVETSFKAFSIWNDNRGFAWRHVVEPYSDITFIPEPNLLPKQIYQFDDIDEIEETKTIRLGVKNGWQYKSNDPQASSDPKDFLHIDIYADFNIDAEEDEDSLKSVNLDLSFMPVTWMELSIEGEYEQEQSEITESLFELSIWHDAFEAEVSYRYYIDESSLVSGLLTWYMNPEWAISLYGRYEYETSRVEKVGTWLQRKYDCIAYRFYLTYEPSFEYEDGRKEEADLEVSLMMWLTCYEPEDLRELDE